MRILIVTQYIYPENFKSNELAFELAKRGHHVEVLTGIPNYPEGTYFKGYGIFKKRIEIVNGAKFYRCFQTPRGRKASGLGLALNYLTFMFFASLWVFFYFIWKKRFDVVISHEPSPITQIVPAVFYGKLRKVPLYSWIMDLWPDAIKNSVSESTYRKVYPILNGITNYVYRNSHKILITSKGFRKMICRDADYNNKIVYYPNWSVDMSRENGEFELPPMPEGFKIMLAGNLGDGQNLDAIGEAMLLLKDIDELKWIFVGNGSWKGWLDDFILENDLSEKAFALGRFPGDTMPSFFKKADAMLVTLRGGFPDLDVTVPARLQSYMSAGRPVLAMIGEGAADLIAESDCGYAVPSGDYKSLADIIRNKVLPNKEEFEKKGKNGRTFYEKEFVLDKCINHIEEIIGIK